MVLQTIKLGILQCDSVLPQFQEAFGNYPKMITELFKQVDPTIELITYDVQHGHYPEQIDECDAYVTTGSKASVYDNEEWITQLETYFRQLHQARIKLIGICFGHQLIAQALGGKVQSAAQGWGVGVHTNKFLNKPKWLNSDKNEFNLVVSHKDQVVELPDNTTVVAANTFCPYASLQIGEHIFTVQGHPEFSKTYSKTLMTHRKKILGEACFQQGIDSLSLPTDHLAFTQWMIDFIKSA